MTSAAAAPANRSAAIDALRGVAAMMVVGFHAQTLLGAGMAERGLAFHVRATLWSGVELFFAISGLLIAGPWLRCLIQGRIFPAPRDYALRRAARILPAYWIGLLGAAILLMPVGSATSWVAHILLLQTYLPGQATALFPVAWTLGVEAAFYVAVPLTARAVLARTSGPIPARRLAAWIAIVWAASAAWLAGVDVLAQAHVGISAAWFELLRGNLPSLLCLFCPGMLVAVAEIGPHERKGSGATPLAATAAVGSWFLAVLVWNAPRLPLRVTVTYQLLAIASGLALWAAVNVRGTTWRAIFSLLAPIGLVSYGVYLWHATLVGFLVAHGLMPAIGPGSIRWLLRVTFVLGLTLPIAAASWFAVERIALRRVARWSQHQRALERTG